MDDYRYKQLCISLIPNLSAAEAQRIESLLDTRTILTLDHRAISRLIGRRYASSVYDRTKLSSQADMAANSCARGGYSLLSAADEQFPPLLRHIYDPPYLLYVWGNLPPAAAGVAVVGTRRATTAGIHRAFMIGASLALGGCPVFSGLAYGIDAAAHAGAAGAGGRTWSVIGSGLESIYPKAHISLCRKMIDAGGGVLTEFPPWMGPKRWTFPKRNRLLSGLSSAVCIVEAPAASGALITADFALEQGRDVLVDGAMCASPRSDGTRKLAEDGAVVVESLQDLLRAVGGNGTMGLQVTQGAPPQGSSVEKVIWYGSQRFVIWRNDEP